MAKEHNTKHVIQDKSGLIQRKDPRAVRRVVL
jgi:hypothetical protein